MVKPHSSVKNFPNAKDEYDNYVNNQIDLTNIFRLYFL